MQSCGSICVVYLVSVRVTVKVRARARGRIDLRRVLVPLQPEGADELLGEGGPVRIRARRQVRLVRVRHRVRFAFGLG